MNARYRLVAALLGAFCFTTLLPAHAAEPDAAAKAEAAKRFDRGLTLFDEGDNAGALAEFKQVYQTMPNPVVLYNIGLVYAAMGRPVDAVEALKQVASHQSLSPAQKERAQSTLNDQQARIGRLTITTVPPGARISIDGVDVATTPLAAPLQVAAGSHVVGAVAAGYAQARREVVVAGNADASVNLELVRADVQRDAKLIVRSRLRGAELFVDGKLAGKTPFASSLSVPAGAHTLELRRPGYVTAKQQIDLGEDATGEVAFDPVMDAGALDAEGVMFGLDVGHKNLELFVDEQHLGPYTGPVRLPRGPHRVRVEAAGFLPLEQDVMLEPGKLNTLNARLEPTPETRAAHDSNVRFHRTMGWVGIGAGALVAGGGGIWLGINSSAKADARDAVNAANAAEEANTGPCALTIDPNVCTDYLDTKQSDYDNAKQKDIIGYVGLGVGGALVVTGVVFLLTGEDADEYGWLVPGAPAKQRVQLSWQAGPDQLGVGLHGSF
jgi:hypothetical protein